MGFEEWWEANFDWLDPPHATTAGLLVLAAILAVGLLVLMYGVAVLWHRTRDKA